MGTQAPDVSQITEYLFLSSLPKSEHVQHLFNDVFWTYDVEGQEITIEACPDQAIRLDGEYHGTSSVSVRVVPGALAVIAL